MKFLAYISVFFAFFQASAFAQNGNLTITPKMLSFDYAQSSGDLSLNCTETLTDALSQDWTVDCGTGVSATRKYLVHLWVTMYQRAVAPEQSYEVLYWITDLSHGANPQSNGSSTTIWFNFDKPSALNSIDLRLGVENDNASLHMVVTPSAK